MQTKYSDEQLAISNGVIDMILDRKRRKARVIS